MYIEAPTAAVRDSRIHFDCDLAYTARLRSPGLPL